MLSGATLANLFSTHPPMASRIERLTGRAPM
jgi:Zn-dependent protease with chaperone function